MARARYTFNIQADWERFLRWEKHHLRREKKERLCAKDP